MGENVHIRRVQFDHHHRVVQADIFTHKGLMHVHWRDAGGDWCCFTSGSFPARPLGIPLIPRIEEMGRMLSG